MTNFENDKVSLSITNGFKVKINPTKIAFWLIKLVLIILIVGTIANVIIYNVAPSTDHKLAKIMQRFDLGHEPSIPAWYSSIALLGSSILLIIIALIKKSNKDKYVLHWFVLSFVFLYLSLDEAVMIHEMADDTLHSWLDSGGIIYFAWVIPGIFFVLLFTLFFTKFLINLEPRTRWLFIASGLVFVGGAIGLELIEGVIVDAQGIEGGFKSFQLTIAQTIEEGLEMFGIVLFIYALLEYINKHINLVVVKTSTREYN